MNITELIVQYSQGIRRLDQYRRSLDRSDPDQADEARTVSGMLSDMRYALDWMRRGRRPGSRKGRKNINLGDEATCRIKLFHAMI